MKAIERLFGKSFGLPGALELLLDRNFDTLARETGPFAVSSDFTLTSSDAIDSVQVDATAGAVTIYLPEQPVGNRRRRVIKTDSSANAVTVDGNGNSINGASTQSLAAQYDSITVEATGTEWLIVAST